MERPNFTPSETETDYIAVPLWSKDGSIRSWTLIDTEDFSLVGTYRWSFGKGYALRVQVRDGEHQTIYLHRLVLKLPVVKDLREGDHKNRNRLDNRRSNLRIATHAQNAQNSVKSFPGKSSEYRGVSWAKRERKWVAYVCPSGRFLSLGYFDDEAEAAQAARDARRRLMPYAMD